jgi:hypothetical protein
MSKIKTFALSAVLACGAGVAWATSPNGTFDTGLNSESIASNGTLTVGWVEKKVSANTPYTYSGTGTFTEACGCANKPGHCPPGQQGTSTPTTVTPPPVTISSHKNQSTITGSMQFVPSTPSCAGVPSCTGGAIHLVPTSITWTNVVVEDTTTPSHPTDSFCAPGDTNCTAPIACIK